MIYTCPQGCTVEIGLSEIHTRSNEKCKDHGLRLSYGKKLKRTASLSRATEKQGGSGAGLRRGKGFAASKEQQDKVRGLPCVGCGKEADEFRAIDPAHLWPRGRGGCDDPACVIPLCRSWSGGGCHRAFDDGELDILPALLSNGYRAEIAHAFVEHEPPVSDFLKRLTGVEWAPINDREAVA